MASQVQMMLMAALNVTRQNNEVASDQAREDQDKKATPHMFSAQQLCFWTSTASCTRMPNWPLNGVGLIALSG